MTENPQKAALRDQLHDTVADSSARTPTWSEAGADEPLQNVSDGRPQQRWVFWLIIISIQMLGPFSTDTYIPNIPTMVKEFNTSDFAAGLTLQVNWVVRGICGLVIGLCSDRCGRRPVFFYSFAIYIIGTVGSFLAPSIEMLILARTIQGIGEANSSLAQAITRDVIEDVQSRARIFYILGTVRPLAIISAPAIGGLIGSRLGWRVVFILLTAWGTMNVSLIYFFLPETAPMTAPTGDAGLGSRMRSALALICCNRITCGLLITVVFWQGCPPVFLSNVAPVMEDWFGLSVVATSLVMAMMPTGILLTSAIMSVVSKKVSTFTCLRAGMCLGFIVAFLMILLAVSSIELNAYIISPLYYCMIMIQPIVMGSCVAIFMQPLADIAGLASGIQSGLGSITAACMAAVTTAATERHGPHAMLAGSAANMGIGEVAFWVTVGCKRRAVLFPNGEPKGKGKGGGKGGGK